MKSLLAFTRVVDWINDRFAVLAKWAVLAACVISAANAAVRYAFDYSSNGFLEIQWYLFAVSVMFGAPQVLRVNEHVRVDVLYGLYPTRTKVVVDLLGLLFFLLPFALLLMWLAFPILRQMYVSHEMSNNPGGLIRWPVMLTIPLGLALLALQAVAELVKRVGWLRGEFEMDTHYERPLQ